MSISPQKTNEIKDRLENLSMSLRIGKEYAEDIESGQGSLYSLGDIPFIFLCFGEEVERILSLLNSLCPSENGEDSYE